MKRRLFAVLLASTLSTVLTTALPVFAAAPSVDLSRFPDIVAADPQTLQLMSGFPPPPDKLIKWNDGSHFRFPNTRWTFSHLRELMQTVTVRRGSGKPTVFPRAERKLDDVSYTDMDGIQRTWGEALAKTWTDGVVVVHRGRIVYEKYTGALDAQRPHIAMSVTKSFTGVLAAMLVHERKIDPEALVTRYLPEMAGTAFADATVRQVMDMTTSFQYSENYADPKAEIYALMGASGFMPTPPGSGLPGNLYSFLTTLKKEGEHDQAFAYKSPNTEVLGWIIRRVTGQSVAQVLSERLWQKMGMEEDAHYLVDSIGTEAASGGLNTTLRDLARMGETMRNKGRFNGQQILPATVVEDIAAGADKAKFAKAGYTTLPNWSYRNQWWVSDQGYYMARGIYGQAIYVDPKNEVVIARYASHPIAANAVQDPIILPAYRAVAAHLNKR